MNHSRDFARGIKRVSALINTQVQNMSKFIFAFQKQYSEFLSQHKLKNSHIIVGIVSLFAIKNNLET